MHNTTLYLSRRSRRLKNLIKSLKPSRLRDNVYVYRVELENGRRFSVIVLCEPVVEYRVTRRYDQLGNMPVTIKEAVVKHCGYTIFYIEWDGQYYRAKLRESPIHIIVKSSDNRELVHDIRDR